MLNGQELVGVAESIARAAHAGQEDKIGVAYIEHPRRVAGRFDAATQPRETAVAWLHDVLEDTQVTENELRAAGIGDDVIDAVKLLSKDDTEADLSDYYARIRVNPLALAVKSADIADNTDPARTAQLPEETRERLAAKYRKARLALGIES